MCGIMGYVGHQEAYHILIDGLRKLEYRGYDSSGVAVCKNGVIQLSRSKGKLSELVKKVEGQSLAGSIGIGHTRWATHGKPSDENAHPHKSNHVVVIHNGIIENHMPLRVKLLESGVKFSSETDTEVIPWLIESFMNEGKSFEVSVREALAKLEGAFSLVIFTSKEPDKIIVAKNASPLILGLGQAEHFVASDIPALLDYTRSVIILEDGDMAVLTAGEYRIQDFSGKPVVRAPKEITWNRVAAEKEGFKHFMLKEIHEQPRAIIDTLRGRLIESAKKIYLDGIPENLEVPSRIVLAACGTSWHAALVAKFWIESLARIPVEVDYASEFRYRNPVVDKSVLFVPISQSGETADTLAALEEAKSRGAKIVSVCNCVDSSIARKSDGVVYTHAGPEIGVASTKAFTTQLTVLLMLALDLAQRKGTVSPEDMRKHIHTLNTLPLVVEAALETDSSAALVARALLHSKNFLFLGRGSSYPIALEGALKLKEISYIHAEGYSAAEMKHGPIALIDENMPVVVLASGGPMFTKVVSNLQEVKARGGRIVSVVAENDQEVSKLSEFVMRIPQVNDLIRPIVESIPMQLLAYHFSDIKGNDVDQPRNLAKSVTVE